MMKETFKHIHTDYMLYVEQDTPLTPDMSINFLSCMKLIANGDANLIRFHYESFIPKEHLHLMIDQSPILMFGESYIRTIQWSQRPHIASVEYYKKVLEENFSPEAKTFIEDKMHSVVIEDYKRQKGAGWDKHKIWIYHPEGGNIKRSLHLDGRGGEQKYSMTF